jgi:hypothetical protein
MSDSYSSFSNRRRESPPPLRSATPPTPRERGRAVQQSLNIADDADIVLGSSIGSSNESDFQDSNRDTDDFRREGAAFADQLLAQMDLEATSAEEATRLGAEFRRTSPQARPGGQSQIKEIIDMKNEELKEFEEYLNENNCLEDQQVIFDPIVMSVYKEPVIASDGNTYDIDTYNELSVPKKSPITREELTGIIYPNLAAKQFILCQLEKYNKEKKSTKGGRRRTKHKKSKRKLKKNTKRKPKRRARKTRKH